MKTTTVNTTNTFVFTAQRSTGETVKILLPQKIQSIFEKAEKSDYEREQIFNFLERYNSLDDNFKEGYQFLANSGRMPVNNIRDLMRIFVELNKYARVSNLENRDYTTLGRLFVQIQGLPQYRGSLPEDEVFALFGESIVEENEGFFVGDSFFWKLPR